MLVQKCKPCDSRNLVGHHDRTGAVLCITKNEVVRGKLDEQPLSDAWNDTNWVGLCETPWQMVAHELRLTEKVTSDKEGAGLHCQGLSLDKSQRLSPEDSACCLQTTRLAVTLEVVQAVQRWHRMEQRQNHTTTNVENESEQLSREL